MPPYADNTFYVIGMQNGWYRDVGISIEPPPLGIKTTAEEWAQLMTTHGSDVCVCSMTSLLEIMDQTSDLQTYNISDEYAGYAICASKDSGAKSVSEFMKEGMAFIDALRAAIQQIAGHGFALDIDPSNRTNFVDPVLSLIDMKVEDLHPTLLSDANIVQSCLAGRFKFESTGGAPQTFQLELAGWKPIVVPLDVTRNVPADKMGPTISLMTNNIGGFTTSEYVSQNMDTCVRLTSVMYRIIDAVQRTPETALPLQIPYLNGVAGLQLKVPDLQYGLSVQTPLINFEDAKRYILDTSSPVYWKTIYSGHIKALQDKGVLSASKQYDPATVFGHVPVVYQALLDAKSNADASLAKIQGQSLSAERSALANSGKTLYSTRDYVDAARFLAAAAS